MRANEALTIEPAKKAHQRLHQAKEFFFEDTDGQMKEQHRQFLELLMGYEPQCLFGARPDGRGPSRVDQANGFCRRRLSSRLGQLELAPAAPSAGVGFIRNCYSGISGRNLVIHEPLEQVFLGGISSRQAGRALVPQLRDHRRTLRVARLLPGGCTSALLAPHLLDA